MATAPVAKIHTGEAPTAYLRIGATGTVRSSPVAIYCERPKSNVPVPALSFDVLTG
jgi:hypothetical protein